MCTALEKLKQEGIDQGIEEGKMLIIKNLLLSGMSPEEVKKAAGATEKEIQQAQAMLKK